MIKTKMAFLKGRRQSELYKYFLNSSDWLDKIRPSKNATCFDHVNRLNDAVW